MPTLSVARASNATYSPPYAPVAVIVGSTSGVGRAIAEALARQTDGAAHIVLVGRNAAAAADIIARFPKPKATNGQRPLKSAQGWTHEFVPCDASSLAAVRAVCAELRKRLERVNFLVMTASGKGANSKTRAGVTKEGLDEHLVMRYFSRYLFTKELLPLLVRAREEGQQAHVMTVCGGGLGMKIPRDDLGLDEARARQIKFLGTLLFSSAAVKGMIRGSAYNDALVASFGAQHPNLAFTHIYPGQVKTPGGIFDAGWLLLPLVWLATLIRWFKAVSEEECAQYMLYALLNAERGMFLRDNRGDVVSAYVFEDGRVTSSTADETGTLYGVPMKGFGGSNASVAGLVSYTEEVLRAI